MRDFFDTILGQPMVRDYLRGAIERDRISQAYLFLGPSGSNKTSAAFALAQAIQCKDCKKNNEISSCDACDVNKKLKLAVHPDVKSIEPQGANGYLVSQIRELIKDVSLSPIELKYKIYIINEVDKLGTSAANAFLKTLEEPPSDVVFILLGRGESTILPTIKSRCNIVAFRHIPPREAYEIISQQTGEELGIAKLALSANGGSITSAIDCLKKGRNMALAERRQIVGLLLKSAESDAWEVCKCAKQLVEIVKLPNDENISRIEKKLSTNSDFLSSGAKKEIEKRNKRALNQASLKRLALICDITLSILQDIIYLNNNLNNITNFDFEDDLAWLSTKADVASVSDAMSKLVSLKSSIAYNISSETYFDALLLIFKGAFR